MLGGSGVFHLETRDPMLTEFTIRTTYYNSRDHIHCIFAPELFHVMYTHFYK